MSNEDMGRRPGSRSGPGRHEPAGSQSSGQSTIDNAKDAISDTAKNVSEGAANVAQDAKERAQELAERGKAMGADQIQGFAQVARGAADDLEKQSPEIAGHVRQAADGLERAASSVRGRSVGEFVDMVDDFARRQPTAFFGSAVLAGFVISRFMTSRADRSYANSRQGRSDMGAGEHHREQAESRKMAEGLRQTGTETRYGTSGLDQTSAAGRSGSDARRSGIGQSMPSTPSSIGEMP